MAQEEAVLEMTTQQQLEEVLGPLLGKHHAEEESRASSPWKKPRPDSARADSSRAEGMSTGARMTQKQSQDLLLAVARMSLRHEDSLNVLQLDSGFMIFAQTATADKTLSIVPLLFQAASVWKKGKEQGPITIPLRTVLMQAMIRTLATRVKHIQGLQQDSPEFRKLIATEVLTQTGTFAYMQWNMTAQKLEQDSTRTPLSIVDVLKMLDQIEKALADPATITKFHSARPLASQMSAAILTFFLHVSLRGEQASQTHAALTRLCGNACLNLVALRMRPENLKRSGLADQIAKMLPRRPDA